jgi:chromosome segregation ATPase
MQLQTLREAHEGLANSQDMRISRIMEESNANIAKANKEATQGSHEVQQLKEIVNNMRNSLSSSSDAADTYKNQLVSLQANFDAVSNDFNLLSQQNEENQGIIQNLHNLSSSSTDLQLEVKALPKALLEEKGRFEALEEERNDAEARASEMRSRLVATSADLDIARTEAQQAQVNSSNLQMAMSNLQDEREAELSMMEQQRLDSVAAEQDSWRTKVSSDRKRCVDDGVPR